MPDTAMTIAVAPADARHAMADTVEVGDDPGVGCGSGGLDSVGLVGWLGWVVAQGKGGIS